MVEQLRVEETLIDQASSSRPRFASRRRSRVDGVGRS
jgi:hypothetical protein